MSQLQWRQIHHARNLPSMIMHLAWHQLLARSFAKAVCPRNESLSGTKARNESRRGTKARRRRGGFLGDTD